MADSSKPFADEKVKFTYLIHKDKEQCICQFFKPNPLNCIQISTTRSRSGSRSRLMSTSPALSSSRSPSCDQSMSPRQGSSDACSTISSKSSGFYFKSNRLPVSPGPFIDHSMSTPNEMAENRNAACIFSLGQVRAPFFH